jgi:hypothetical protein
MARAASLASVRPRRGSGLLRAVLLGALGCGVATAAPAEVTVTGTVAAAQISASNEPVGKVLAAVAQAFRIRYSTSIALDDVVSGTYSGALGAVMSSLLSRYNYVIKYDGGTADIVVLGARGEHPIAVAPPPARTFASQWR